MDRFTKGMTLIILSMISIPISYILYGYTISTLWSWYIVPTFKLPPVSIPIAIGMWLIVQLGTAKMYSKEEAEAEMWKPLLTRLGGSLLLPVLTLLAGYIILQFI